MLTQMAKLVTDKVTLSQNKILIGITTEAFTMTNGMDTCSTIQQDGLTAIIRNQGLATSMVKELSCTSTVLAPATLVTPAL